MILHQIITVSKRVRYKHHLYLAVIITSVKTPPPSLHRPCPLPGFLATVLVPAWYLLTADLVRCGRFAQVPAMMTSGDLLSLACMSSRGSVATSSSNACRPAARPPPAPAPPSDSTWASHLSPPPCVLRPPAPRRLSGGDASPACCPGGRSVASSWP